MVNASFEKLANFMLLVKLVTKHMLAFCLVNDSFFLTQVQ